MQNTEQGTLFIGYCDDDGVYHKDFTMRLPTLQDVEEAIMEAGDNACQARVNRYTWAKTLVSLGTLTSKDISPALLAKLCDVEYGRLSDVETTLRKKLAAMSETTGNWCSPHTRG